MPGWVRVYRWGVLLLAAFYFIDRFSVETYDLTNFGWQFRYLTIWALTLSLVAGAMMLTPALGSPDKRGAIFVSVTATVNMIVVVSYWRLYFDDPALVNGGKAIVAYREYYLHLVGPVLQWIDVLFIKRAFRNPLRTVAWLFVLVLVYVAWTEAVIAPLNATPVGEVTDGLPYPFLNDMALRARMSFYAATFASGVVFAGFLWGVQSAADRLRGRPAIA